MKKVLLLLPALTLVLVLGMAVGCGKNGSPPVSGGNAAAVNEAGHDVSGWCVEHGVPEKICSLCDSKVAAESQKNGDWCQEHNRAKSQCFICSPELAEKFVIQYEVQHGKKPPLP
ncbi:MAG: hypothetical protein LBQ54_15970 [Planctomycetaceae bacterium]|nr:hypothetical protein [Planctomycetaceae bacterium]